MKYLAAAAVLGLAGAASANFDMVMQEFTFTGSDVPATIQFMKAGELSNLPLKQVIFEYTLTASGSDFAVDNDRPNGGTIDVIYGATGFVSSDDVTLPALAVNAENSELGLFLGPDDEQGGVGPLVLDIDAGADFFALDPLVNVMDSNMFDSPLFGEYAGLGTFDVVGDITQSFSITGQLNGAVAFAGSQLSTSATLKLTYIYSPAPGAMALMGLAGFAGIRRRRA